MVRWFSWFDIVSTLVMHWHAVLMTLVYVLRSEATITNIHDLARDRSLEKIKAAEAKTAAKSAATPAKTPTKARSTADVDSAGEKPKPQKPGPKPQRPNISHEKSRSQWLVRSAFDGSRSFGYGVGGNGVKREFSTESKAKAAARAWLAKQRV